MTDIQEILAAIGPPDREAEEAATRRWNNLTKPEGSLGRLEELADRIAGITGSSRPRVRRKGVLVFAADHGVAQEGVSAYPPSVTAAMVRNFLDGGAAISVLSRWLDAQLTVIDVGVDSPPAPDRDGFRCRKIRKATRNFLHEPAMTLEEARRAVEVGAIAVEEARDAGVEILAVGDMGIGNTTSASALTAALTREPVGRLVGSGTGVSPEGLRRKVQVVEQALARHRKEPWEPWDVLCSVGGLEIAAMGGAFLRAASLRVPVLVDGFIASSAALWASTLAPQLPHRLLASHRSQEPGHRIVLEHLQLRPYLELEMRLGEATGAALALALCDAACRLLDEMATFEEAEVSRRRTE